MPKLFLTYGISVAWENDYKGKEKYFATAYNKQMKYSKAYSLILTEEKPNSSFTWISCQKRNHKTLKLFYG